MTPSSGPSFASRRERRAGPEKRLLCPDLIRHPRLGNHQAPRKTWMAGSSPAKAIRTHRFPAQIERTISAELTCGAADPYLGHGPDASRRFRLPVAPRADRRSPVRAARGRAPAAHPGGRRFADRRIADLPALLRPGDLLVCNDTKVIPARLVARRGGATIDITLCRDQGCGSWRAFAKGARRLHVGDRLAFAEDFAATVAEKHPQGE